ncbi:Nitroreductase-like protein [Aspergillus lucknowensis]|uniref:Nitroreductase-like protein n=1 Tax=Aspergillus lucknowensis TaxID=176173 RepID=A0ABR4M0V5_9EURO
MALPRVASRRFSPMPSLLCRDSFRWNPSISAAVQPFSSTSSARTSGASATSKTKTLTELAKALRTVYRLGKNSPVSDSRIEELVKAAILNVPSAFNTQSTRLLVLLHREHERLWEIVIGVFQNLVKTGVISEEDWEKQTLPKLEGFKAGVGTILFYEDRARILPFSEKFALYKANSSPGRNTQMPCISISTGLESLGFGANLQRYNPLIDEPVAKQWISRVTGGFFLSWYLGVPRERLVRRPRSQLRSASKSTRSNRCCCLAP